MPSILKHPQFPDWVSDPPIEIPDFAEVEVVGILPLDEGEVFRPGRWSTVVFEILPIDDSEPQQRVVTFHPPTQNTGPPDIYDARELISWVFGLREHELLSFRYTKLLEQGDFEHAEQLLAPLRRGGTDLTRLFQALDHLDCMKRAMLEGEKDEEQLGRLWDMAAGLGFRAGGEYMLTRLGRRFGPWVERGLKVHEERSSGARETNRAKRLRIDLRRRILLELAPGILSHGGLPRGYPSWSPEALASEVRDKWPDDEEPPSVSKLAADVRALVGEGALQLPIRHRAKR